MKYFSLNKTLNNIVNMQTATANKDTEYNIMMANQEIKSPKKAKRFRSAFTTDQINYLEIQFKKFPYIGNAQRKEVAITLNIPERAVKIWFQNRRMKEKKEMVNKEVDDETTLEPQCFAKDQLNNVCTQSTNDRQAYSLPLLTGDNKTNSNNVMINKSVPCSLITGPLITNPGVKGFNFGTSANIKLSAPHTVKARYPNATIKAKTEHSRNAHENHKHVITINQHTKPLTADQNMKQSMEYKSKNCKHLEQIIPEDLSSRKTNISTTGPIQVQNIMPSNPGYISMVPTVSPFYGQPYYSAGGVLWKPVNVVSTAPGGIPPTVHESVSKKCCGCDCHVKSLVPYSVQQQSPNPQYIFTAVPFASATKY